MRIAERFNSIIFIIGIAVADGGTEKGGGQGDVGRFYSTFF
jgi:hypothetical protein